MAMASAAGYRGQYQVLPSTFSWGIDLWILGCHESLAKLKPSCCTPNGKTTWGQRGQEALLSQASAWCLLGLSQPARASLRAACPAPKEEGPCWAQTPSCETQWCYLLFMCLLTCYTERGNQKRLNLNQNLCIQKCIKKVESSRKTPLPPRPTFTVHYGMRVGEGRGEGPFEFHVSCFCIN